MVPRNISGVGSRYEYLILHRVVAAGVGGFF